MATFPPRCFTCGKVTVWGSYEKLIVSGIAVDTALDRLGYRRMCCRRMFLGHVPELEEKMLLYSKNTDPNDKFKKLSISDRLGVD